MVTRTRTSMDDFSPMQVGQPVQHALRHFPQYLFAGPSPELFDLPVHAIQAPALAEFHRDRNIPRRIVPKRAIILANMFRRTFFVEGQLAHNLLLDIRVWVRRDDLQLSSARSLPLCQEEPSCLQGKLGLAPFENTSSHGTTSSLP